MSPTRPFMYGKLHRVTVTEANLDYVGSVTIDPLLLQAARIYPHTGVDIVNISTGSRVETYVIEGPRGSGAICVNGAAAHLFKRGDLAIIMGYEQVPVAELAGRISRAVLVGQDNAIREVRCYKTPRLHELGRPENNRLGELFPLQHLNSN
ncbi:MAG: aspartate 1-decarboxylase [Candidatus Thiodiazotropha sp.]